MDRRLHCRPCTARHPRARLRASSSSSCLLRRAGGRSRRVGDDLRCGDGCDRRKAQSRQDLKLEIMARRIHVARAGVRGEAGEFQLLVDLGPAFGPIGVLGVARGELALRHLHGRISLRTCAAEAHAPLQLDLTLGSLQCLREERIVTLSWELLRGPRSRIGDAEAKRIGVSLPALRRCCCGWRGRRFRCALRTVERYRVHLLRGSHLARRDRLVLRAVG